MFLKKIGIALFFVSITIFSAIGVANAKQKTVTISTPKITMVLNYNNTASITSLVINGQKVISGADGIYTSLKAGGVTYSSLHLNTQPVLVKTNNRIEIRGIVYGNSRLTINENWIFTTSGKTIKWDIERKLSKAIVADEAASPVMNFESINTWEGAYQGYGGLAWFYLFNEKLCTYGVHTRSSDFWNSKTDNGLNITVNAPGKQVAMVYSRTNDDKLAYTITASDKEMLPKLDSGTHRRRFLRKRTDVWAPFTMPAGTSTQHISFTYFSFNQKYGRGKMVGVNGKQVGDVLNTIARIGVIDSLHYGGNSWATPYGPICLHEQYIGLLGLGINDPHYLKGYESCLNFYRDHAIKPDGRVYPRWAYTNEDAMHGKYNKEGFYEAQWGILMDSNPDFVANVADLYNMTGNKAWVKSQQQGCEKALDWILNRDSNGNGLVEMMNDNETQKVSSDWIDIIWASYENAFVNAKLYHALTGWAAIERQLNNTAKANYYANFAAKLKASFNKSTKDGGFWDEEKQCYVHWLDKDKSVHGRNMVTPVNFMAIAYGICDNPERRKTILDNIETQMQQEKLFFWPLCMNTYAPGEGNGWQFPFPAYENGDLFLSWGSIAIKAYASYKPELAVKYVRNVLEQYSKDGLAFQRYGRLKQDGLGDDILSGNSLTIVGLYQSIYGLNPMYNRLYLDPHITPELAGTELKYNFRNERLTVSLDSNSYAVANNQFKVISPKKFGFYALKNQLWYFNGDNANAALQVSAASPLTIAIQNWDTGNMAWAQSLAKLPVKSPSYIIHQLKANTYYMLAVNGKPSGRLKSNAHGELAIQHQTKALNENISITRK